MGSEVTEITAFLHGTHTHITQQIRIENVQRIHSFEIEIVDGIEENNRIFVTDQFLRLGDWCTNLLTDWKIFKWDNPLKGIIKGARFLFMLILSLFIYRYLSDWLLPLVNLNLSSSLAEKWTSSLNSIFWRNKERIEYKVKCAVWESIKWWASFLNGSCA